MTLNHKIDDISDQNLIILSLPQLIIAPLECSFIDFIQPFDTLIVLSHLPVSIFQNLISPVS